jgi:hypothetical protein
MMKGTPVDWEITFGSALTGQLSGFNHDSAYMDLIHIDGEHNALGEVKNGRVELVCVPLLCASDDECGSLFDRTEMKANMVVFAEGQRDLWEL